MEANEEKQVGPSLLEAYVLWCIGHLSSAEEQALREATPQLRREYQQSGEWQDMVTKTLGFSESWEKQVRQVWQRNSELARLGGSRLSPREFAAQVIVRKTSQ